MEYARTCGECTDYCPARAQGIGVCVRIEDLAYVVAPTQTRCLYTCAGERLSAEAITARDEAAQARFAQIDAAAVRAREQIDSMPAWKRQFLGYL